MCYHYTIGECASANFRSQATAKIKRFPLRKSQTLHFLYLGGMLQLLNLIGSELKPANDGGWLDQIEPATGEITGRLPRSKASDVDQAYAAAAQAFPTWSTTPVEGRAACLRKLAQLISHNSAQLATPVPENTRPVSMSRHRPHVRMWLCVRRVMFRVPQP